MSVMSSPAGALESPGSDPAQRYQERILGGVSRSFALTIPLLPEGLRATVTNAYLLCRIADTIEDDPELSCGEKREFGRQFLDVLNNRLPAETFGARLAPRLARTTLAAERDLIAHADLVTTVTAGLPADQRAALLRCVTIMSHGMHHYQQEVSLQGLRHGRQLDEYCYFVAGVVGEMLTELFCAYSPVIARHRDALMHLAPSFGQGLQMTNILKDIWEDRGRGACWLPQEDFQARSTGQPDLLGRIDLEQRRAGLKRLVARAHGHLHQALRYTLTLPADETGIRQFCLGALGMAVLTLRKIHRQPAFSHGSEVKISRQSVAMVFKVGGLLAGRDTPLRALFALASLGLPTETGVEPAREVTVPIEPVAIDSGSN